jgi:hypothetical protein
MIPVSGRTFSSARGSRSPGWSIEMKQLNARRK